MDCVFDAYVEYLNYMHIPAYDYEFNLWQELKLGTHGAFPQFTFGGVAPWMIAKLAEFHGLLTSIQYSFYSLEDYDAIARKDYEAYYERMKHALYFLKISGTFVNEITFEPAIYFNLLTQHASFQDKISNFKTTVIPMAIKLRRLT